MEKLVISAESVQEISGCPSPSTKQSLQLLSLRDLMLILSVIQMREHLEHLLSQVILRDGLLTQPYDTSKKDMLNLKTPKWCAVGMTKWLRSWEEETSISLWFSL